VAAGNLDKHCGWPGMNADLVGHDQIAGDHGVASLVFGCAHQEQSIIQAGCV
jgi:hypothetical protein